MAIFHHETKIVSRKAGQSVCACASYRSGEKIEDDRYGKTHDYTRKEGIVHTEILAPEGAPDWVNDRQKLWNEVERAEKRGDAQLAREVNLALPTELSREEQIQFTRDYVKDNYVSKGMIADIAIHDKEDGNPHAHIMLTMRDIDRDGFKNKNRDWNEHSLATEYRKDWADRINAELEKRGIEERVDHRSNKERGLEELPTIHLGPDAHAMEKRGVQTELGDINRERVEYNNQLGRGDAWDIDRKISKLEDLKAHPVKFYEIGHKLWDAKVEALLDRQPTPEIPPQTSKFDRGEVLGRSREVNVNIDTEDRQKPAKEITEPQKQEEPQNVIGMATVKDWKEICKKKVNTLGIQEKVILDEMREVARENHKLHQPYIKEVAEQYFTEKYKDRMAENANKINEIDKAIAEHNKTGLFSRIFKSDEVNRRAEELTRMQENAQRAKVEWTQALQKDVANAEKGVFPSHDNLANGKINNRAKEVAMAKDPTYKEKAKPLNNKFKELSAKSTKINSEQSRYRDLGRKLGNLKENQTLDLPIKIPNIPVLNPLSKFTQVLDIAKDVVKNVAKEMGSGGGGSVPDPQGLQLPSLKNFLLGGDSKCVALTARSAEDTEIDWAALTPEQAKEKMNELAIEREDRGMSR